MGVTRWGRPALVLGVLALAAVSPSCTRRTPPPVGSVGVKEAVAERVQEQYQAVARGAFEEILASFTPETFSMGVGGGDLFPDPTAALAHLHNILDPLVGVGGRLECRSQGMHVGVAPDSRSAWVGDEVLLTVTTGDTVRRTVLRLTELWVEQGGRWWVMAASVSHAMPSDSAFARSATGRWPRVADVGDRVGREAQTLVGLLEEACSRREFLVPWVSDRDDVLLFGTADNERVQGGEAVKRVLGEQIRARDIRVSHAGVRAGLAPSSTVGWVAASVDLATRDPQREDRRLVQPQRVLLVFLKEASGWKLVQGHFSNPAEGALPELPPA